MGVLIFYSMHEIFLKVNRNRIILRSNVNILEVADRKLQTK